MTIVYFSANDISKENKRSKVLAKDVYQALRELGLEKYEHQLQDFMQNYDQDKEEKKLVKQQGVKRGVNLTAEDDQIDLNQELESISIENKRKKVDEEQGIDDIIDE